MDLNDIIQDENTKKVFEINLKDVVDYINSETFNNFLLSTTSYENALFISGVLCQTIDYMLKDNSEEKIDKEEKM